jgi:hypothetical protein
MVLSARLGSLRPAWSPAHAVVNVAREHHPHGCGAQEEDERMKKMWLVGLLVASVLIAGTASAGENIKIGVSVWLGYAPLYLAKEKGFFQKRGLDVDVVVINSPVDRRAAHSRPIGSRASPPPWIPW